MSILVLEAVIYSLKLPALMYLLYFMPGLIMNTLIVNVCNVWEKDIEK